VAGEHTRAIQIATPTIGGLMKFAVKTVTCLGCRTPLKSGKGKSDLVLRKTELIRQKVRFASTADQNFQSYIRNRSVPSTS
jgi:DNA polymerase delta subunit 1